MSKFLACLGTLRHDLRCRSPASRSQAHWFQNVMLYAPNAFIILVGGLTRDYQGSGKKKSCPENMTINVMNIKVTKIVF
jgi:hypothetical protein